MDSRFHGNDEISDGIGIFVFWWASACRIPSILPFLPFPPNPAN
uniref:Uncharacterized protein n=1 Tax=Neisseria meningitidis alpha522 TaxID=996307 RepID=I4E4S2_NEIME|nr:hypothetical protein NMALPHA522_0797 [Neisseria meningitidis alpha522]